MHGWEWRILPWQPHKTTHSHMRLKRGHCLPSHGHHIWLSVVACIHAWLQVAMHACEYRHVLLGHPCSLCMYTLNDFIPSKQYSHFAHTIGKSWLGLGWHPTWHPRWMFNTWAKFDALKLNPQFLVLCPISCAPMKHSENWCEKEADCDVFANSQWDGLPGQWEVCPQGPCCQELHVSQSH